MSKNTEARIELNGTVKKYQINRSYLSYLVNKYKYKGSLLYEYTALTKKLDDEEALIKISGDFETIIRDIKSSETEKIESKIAFEPDAQEDIFKYEVGKDGRHIGENTYRRILSSIDKGEVAKDYLDIDKVKSIGDMENDTKLLAKYTTKYSTSGEARKTNIRLAAKYINGSIIKAKEQFSFNEVVGERTAERGFREAKVIVNGEYVKGYGGGVCQVSTTLYNAWVLAGGGVIYASSHSLPPHYIDLSRDAMVSSYNDLILVNNGESPLYVRSISNNDSITFEIYGEETNVKYAIESETTKVIPAETKYIGDTTENEEYYEIEVSGGSPAYESRAYLLTYDMDGKLLERKLLREDSYRSQPRLVERVKAG